MAIFRGVGGSGDSSDNSFLQEVTTQANAASASASAASASAVLAQASANSILTLTAATGAAGTDVSYNASTGVLTVPRGADGTDASVTAANVTGVLTGGTGISIASNGTITNDSPDQTVALTGTGATTITGTYPNFTINSVNTTYTVGDGGLTTNDFTDADHTKLNGIEANATADQTGAEIKSAYEAVADTNAYTDAEKTKLSGIEASATADQTDAEIKTAYENNADTNAFTDADHTKLDGLKGTLTSNYWDSMQWQQGASRALTTALTQYGDQQFVKHVSSTYKTYVDLSLDLVYNSASGTNDAYGYLSVTAPPPAGETTVNMGPCVIVSSGVSYIQGFSVVGDWTEYFSRYIGISKNSDGSNAMGYPYKWVYSSNANRTTVWVSLYGNPPSNGDTIYLHPFDWESSGTLINGEQLLLDNSSSSGVSARRDFKLYLGRFYQRTGYRFQAKKVSSSDVVTLDTIRMTTTEYEA